jgi:lipopolysaccharide/colanic/teichoic acid biosynthesis glycosyltransferase
MSGFRDNKGTLVLMAHITTDKGSPSAGNIEVFAGNSAFLRSKKKRAVDLFTSVFGLLITAVMLPLIALLIKLDSRGPIFYRQKRLGLDGNVFVLHKFRTMVDDAEDNGGAVWATNTDPRITRIGWLLRTIYIDEFPQWWNVFKGDMSAIGPRPERPEMSKLISREVPGFSKRLGAKPGISGLAQVEYKYANTVSDSRHKLSFDQIYISKASSLIDMWIMVRTIRRMLLRRGT